MTEFLRTVRAQIRPPVLLLAAVLLVAVPWLVRELVELLRLTDGYHLDLEVYRLGVRAWLAGGDMYGDLPPTISGLALPFIYPPFAAIVLTPLVLLPWTAAWITLFAVSMIALAVTLYVVAARLWRGGGWMGAVGVTAVALPLALQLEPVPQTLGFGQINLILMALVTVDCLAEKPPWPRGLLVGIAAAIKLTPAAFVLFFLLRRDTRAATVTVLTAVAVTVAGFAVDAGASLRYWFDGPASEVSGSVFFTNQTVQAVLARAGVGEPVATAVWLVLAAGLLALIVPVVRHADAPVAMLAIATFALQVSPTSWSHHWVWIVPAVLAAAASAVRERSIGWAVAVVLLWIAFYEAPFHELPRDGGQELAWTTGQQVIGATYVIVGAVALLALRLRQAQRLPRSRVDAS